MHYSIDRPVRQDTCPPRALDGVRTHRPEHWRHDRLSPLPHFLQASSPSHHSRAPHHVSSVRLHLRRNLGAFLHSLSHPLLRSSSRTHALGSNARNDVKVTNCRVGDNGLLTPNSVHSSQTSIPSIPAANRSYRHQPPTSVRSSPTFTQSESQHRSNRHQRPTSIRSNPNSIRLAPTSILRIQSNRNDVRGIASQCAW